MLMGLINEVLSSGITAHVDFDLARALQFSFKSPSDVGGNVTFDTLHLDFGKTNTTFAGAGDEATKEISNAGFGTITNTVIKYVALQVAREAAVFYDSTDEVIKHRQLAWNKAIALDGSPLVGINQQPLIPQPQTDHLPLEKMGVNNCRGKQ